MIDEQRLRDALRARVARDLEALEGRQRDSQEGSTHAPRGGRRFGILEVV